MKTNTKLYLKIIGVLLIILPFADFIINDGWSDVKRGFNDAHTKENKSYEFFSLIPKSNQDLNIDLPKINGEIITKSINVEVLSHENIEIIPFYFWAIYLILAVIGLFMIVSVIILIKKFINNQLFEITTYQMLLYFGFSIISFSILNGILDYIRNYKVSKLIENSNYSLVNNQIIDSDSLFIGLFILAFSVALKQSINIKNENDLTI